MFAAVFAATLALGLFGLSRTAAVNDAAADVRDNWLPSTVALGKLEFAVGQYRIAEARLLLSYVANHKDPAEIWHVRDGEYPVQDFIPGGIPRPDGSRGRH